ncbi:hypothetical protein Tco_1004370 [Tanacetum coccineum]|uniref:Uncharacterized protein n=1 Tax=Tanacetum coccineum TaxID=301880 RepID=A0ABQ5FDL9_9ASTR
MVNTERCPSKNGKGFARIVAGCIGGQWTPNPYPVVIKDPAGSDAGYCRELVFYSRGVNTHRTMWEFYTCDKVERATIICTASYEDPVIKKQLAILKTGGEAAWCLKEKARDSRKS